jgi:aspartate aminotransferase
MHLSRRALSLQQSAIRKLDIDVAKQQGVHFHRLNIGQPDVPTPKEILEALAADDGPVLAYGPASGLPACREAAAAFHARTSPGLTAAHVVVTQGGSEAILFALLAVCDPGDEVIVPEPFYTNYNGFSTAAGTRVVPVRTKLDDGFALPSDAALDAVVTERTRAILFSNPGNPTGAVYDRESLARVAAWAKRKNLWIVADEVYRSIWFTHAPFSALELHEHSDRVIVVDSTSKTFSSCGLRIGFLVSRNSELMERIERLGQARLGPQPRAQRAAIRALGLAGSYIEEVRAIYKKRVDTMMDALAALPDVRFHRPAGAFYTMARLPVDDTDAFGRFLVQEFRDTSSGKPESVVIAPGGGFYADPSSGKDEVRLAAVRDEAVLKRAIEVLGRGIAAYRARG